MPDYSVFLLDADGKVSKSSHITENNDQEALQAAKTMIPLGHEAAEVWLLARMVGSVRRSG